MEAIREHIDKILSSLILAGILWVGANVQTLKTDYAVLSERLAGLQVQVEQRMADRYTRTEGAALAARVLRVEQLTEIHDARLDRIDNCLSRANLAQP